MKQTESTPTEKPYDLHERLLVFACEVMRAVQFLHSATQSLVNFRIRFLPLEPPWGANYEESDGASSLADFVAKTRIALKEAKETRFRLRVCRRSGLLDAEFDPLVRESDEIVRILGKIVHNARRRS